MNNTILQHQNKIILPVKPDGIPQLLRDCPRWITWTAGKLKPNGRYDKQPRSVATGQVANAHDPASWGTFDQAYAAHNERGHAGVGFDLPNDIQPFYTTEDGRDLYLIGIDFDECLTYDEHGKPHINPEVGKIILQLGKRYFEKSPSGTGIRMFGLYGKPLGPLNRDHKEVYSSGRFLTITGHGKGEIKELPPVIEEMITGWRGEQKPISPLITITPSTTAETSNEIVRVKSALAAINPDCGYDLWRNLVWSITSLHWQCGEHLAREWSMQGQKWDADAFDSVWAGYDSTKPDAITIGTLFHHAKEAGWVDPRHATEDRQGDLMNARLFAREMSGRLLFNHTRNKWHEYDGQRWRPCDKGEEMQAARLVVERIIEFAAKKIAALPSGDPKAKEWGRHLLRCQNLNAIEAMVKLAQSETGIGTKHDELDADPWRMGCLNGVVDLRAGILLGHDPALKITQLARANFDRTAQCPQWLQFLNRIFAGDQETISAIQRMVGYSLLGVLLEEVFFFAYGSGANGKSVFFNVLEKVLADYAIVVPAATLMTKRDGESATNDIARMAGARFAIANETKTGDKLDDQKLKQLASRDRIAARYLYGEFFEFDPSATVWIRGNHKPIVTDDSDGLWRRLVLIPFTQTIPEDERDPYLTDKLMNEADGIFMWALEGCISYQQQGLKPSVTMRRASAEYRKETDILGEWLETCCTIDPGAKAEQASAFDNYRRFCLANGLHPMSKKIFTRKLDERGFKGNAYVNRDRAYTGFRLSASHF